MCMIQAVHLHDAMHSFETILTAHENSSIMVVYDPALYLEIKFKKVILAI